MRIVRERRMMADLAGSMMITFSCACYCEIQTHEDFESGNAFNCEQFFQVVLLFRLRNWLE